ncbi:MAG: hypothetical protein LH605_03965 [Microbacteriaceae bacterium]|nr:hypothetical protein [Microbacteriaceae bacterium]
MPNTSTKPIAVIGGGIIGAAVARELTRVMPDSALVRPALNVRNLP